MANIINGIHRDPHRIKSNFMVQAIKKNFNIRVGHVKSYVNVNELIPISNVLIEHRSLLRKYPLNEMIKESYNDLRGLYDWQLKRVTFSCKSSSKSFLYMTLRHELAHHLSLEAFSLEDWMNLSILNHFKVLDGNNLADLKIASKQQLIDISRINSWFIVIGNKILAFCSEQIPSATIAACRINDAKKDLSVKTGLKEKEIDVYLTNGNRFKNIFEMVADDLACYIKTPQNYEKMVIEASKNNAVKSRAMSHEMELFKKYFPHF